MSEDKVIEDRLYAAGISPLAGVDEAGRGACAGPLVVASVILRDPHASELAKVRDSKEISEKNREELFDVVTDAALSVSIVIISNEEIDARGVHAANLDGMRRAVQGLEITPAYVLTDGYAIEGLALPNLAVWKGDQVVTCISAASIIAKVTRDRIMRELDLAYPEYGFASHKGYITKTHTEALQKHGVTPIHRKSFSNIAELL
ncbi:MAG: ribonuclease HII [Actinobacteria bacterium]|uniref:Ribonuclease HII n=1 Tax=freshwater metagenome TaxID=449393 RepID=A0A6J6JUY7_9ZZZZ|nr:ribonuclease HII [Actinomycetota bacterium]MTA39218.1 ribonuclease HII [Actinomycetota bacterium]